MKEISLYIHIPFCKQKCFYCDFASFAGKERYREDYIEALIKEIHNRCEGYIINTIFIGGGTPSHLENKEIQKLLEEIKVLNLSKDIEFTMECNPGTLTEEKLIVMKDGGVNRLSFGLQSTDNRILKKIGRIHNYEDFLSNFNLARKFGFNNINVDLMYGLPDLTVETWTETIRKICKLKPEHISAYSLIIEEDTPFFKMFEKGDLNIPEEDEERAMNAITKALLKEFGYHQYEISNYSQKNRECRHNIAYWKLEEYIGVGTAASSYIDNFRIKNIDSVEVYINSIENPSNIIEEKLLNSREDNIEEYVFMGLRLIEGIDIHEFEARFGVDIVSIYRTIIDKNIEKGLLAINKDKMYLTDKGIEISNSVMAQFLLDK